MKCAKTILWVSALLIWPCHAHNEASRRVKMTEEHFKSSKENELKQVTAGVESTKGWRNVDENGDHLYSIDLEQCRQRFVCDPDSILSHDQYDALERELQLFSNRSYSQPSMQRTGAILGGLPITATVSIQLHVVLMRKVRER
jgi:hypothetical protein